MKFGTHVYHVILQLFTLKFFDDVINFDGIIIYFLLYDFFRDDSHSSENYSLGLEILV